LFFAAGSQWRSFQKEEMLYAVVDTKRSGAEIIRLYVKFANKVTTVVSTLPYLNSKPH
jgi:hypothetical protein